MRRHLHLHAWAVLRSRAVLRPWASLRPLGVPRLHLRLLNRGRLLRLRSLRRPCLRSLCRPLDRRRWGLRLLSRPVGPPSLPTLALYSRLRLRANPPLDRSLRLDLRLRRFLDACLRPFRPLRSLGRSAGLLTPALPGSFKLASIAALGRSRSRRSYD